MPVMCARKRAPWLSISEEEVALPPTGCHPGWVSVAPTFRSATGASGTPNVRLYHDQGRYKPALHGDEVPWHQDNGYWKLEPPGAASCWIALDDATLENGCMWVIPGSHLVGDAPHQRAGDYVAQLAAEAD